MISNPTRQTYISATPDRHCDYCGKQRRIVTRTTVTIDANYDWADTISEDECLSCRIKSTIRSYTAKAERKTKAFNATWKLRKEFIKIDKPITIKGKPANRLQYAYYFYKQMQKL